MIKKSILYLSFIVVSFNVSFSQEWLTSISVAERLALTQNKLLLVVWDESADFPLPTEVYSSNGTRYFFMDLFESEELNEVVWDNFIPVFVNEAIFDDWFDSIKYKRSFEYLEKFKDDTIKIMDVNGNLLSTAYIPHDPLNLSAFLVRYSMDTSFMSKELRAYRKEKNFYSSFYLGSKYIDYALVANIVVRKELLNLSTIYLDEAEDFSDDLNEEEKEVAKERLYLTRLNQDLLLLNPNKVIRKLRRYNKSDPAEVNKQLVVFLYYTAYKMNGEEGNARLWKDKLSSINLKKADMILNPKI